VLELGKQAELLRIVREELGMPLDAQAPPGAGLRQRIGRPPKAP
jgi:hypothetical protein